jgi:hypothetical protein
MVRLKSGKLMNKFHYETFKLPQEVRGKVRSKFWKGIADAMAEQWGKEANND